ncbi:LOW QUALITY PROTEIN: hypothetical protein HID58_014608 [Brassica napus]|uniref:Uncharacterized protein n=1 Tax=Brassica napus TaxID=3708 RepID=A0ABQ8DK84_BRANA|nr:LOW QUALITY PROTEIN: hypothetical protein HID58_014608 [Brassica napus]
MGGSTLLSPFLTRRTKSKFVVTPPANGGNERDDDTKFSNESDSPMKLFLKLSLSLEIPASEEQGETKASEDDTQSSKVFVKLITGAKWHGTGESK